MKKCLAKVGRKKLPFNTKKSPAEQSWISWGEGKEQWNITKWLLIYYNDLIMIKHNYLIKALGDFFYLSYKF